MAVARMDEEVLGAIRTHLADRHGRELKPEGVVVERKGRLPAGVLVVVVPETAASPAWFSCLLCSEGDRRYRVDLFASPLAPLVRHVRAMGSHFLERHQVEFGAEDVYRGPESADRALCTYLPSRPARGAAFLCSLCPTGYGRVILEDPAYGDARRLVWLFQTRPGLWDQVRGLGSLERAERVEAIDRGVVPVVQQSVVRRAVRRARSGPPVGVSSAVDQALGQILQAGARVGGSPRRSRGWWG